MHGSQRHADGAGRSRRRCWRGVLLALLLAVGAPAEPDTREGTASREPLIITQDHAWPPFAYLDGNGEHGGLFVSEERDTFLDFSDELLPLRTVAFTAPELLIPDLDALDNQAIGLVAGSFEKTFMQSARPDLALRSYSNNDAIVQAAVANEIGAFVGVSLIVLLLAAAAFLLSQRRWLRQQVIARTEELHQARDQIRKTLGFMHRVTDNVPGIIFSFRRSADGQGDSFPYISDRVTEWFDLTPEELGLDSAPLLRRIEPRDAEAVARSIDQSAGALSLWRGQFRMRFRDGEYRWINAQSMPEAQDDDSIVWYGHFVEVQDYKRIENALRARERQFRLIVENANDIIYTVNAEGIVTYASPNWTTMLGHPTSEVQGRPLEAFVYSDDQAQWRAFLREVLGKGEKKTDLEFRIRHANGDLRWYMSNAAPIRDDEIGEAVYLGIGRDITPRRIAEQEQRYQLRFQRLVAQISSHFVDFGFGNIDPQIEYLLRNIGEFFEVDRSYLFRFSPDQTTMTNTHEWCAPGISSVSRSMQNVPMEDMAWSWQQITGMVDYGEVVFLRDIEDLPEEAAAERERLRSQQVRSMFGVPVRVNQQVIGFFGVDSVTERDWREDQADLLLVISNLLSSALEKNRLEQEVIDMSVTDPLTGLPNRRYLESRIVEVIEAYSRHDQDFAIAILDLDHFKRINDTYGHVIGDNTLRQFAAILRDCVRITDIVARYGGEEFMVLFPDTSRDAARQSVERVLHQTRSLKERDDDQVITITVSAGLAMGSELAAGNLSFESLTAVADARLFRAKGLGRDRMVWSD